MRIKKLFTFIFLILTAVFLPLVSGCSVEDSEGPRKTGLLVYVGPDGLWACNGEDGSDSVLLASGEHIYAPHISPDGRYVYYNNSSDIFVVSTDGGTPTLAAPAAKFSGFFGGRLLSCSDAEGVRAYDPETGVSESLFPMPETGAVSSVVLSPDGKKFVANVEYTDVGMEYPEGVYIRYADIADIDRFTAESICGRSEWLTKPLCWLNDGGAVVFSCGAAGEERTKLYLLPTVDGAASELGGSSMQYRADSGAAISADGKTAALMTYKNSDDLVETICILDLTRGKCSYIPSGTSGVSGVALSGDGSLVAYTSSGEASGLYVYSKDATLRVVGGDGRNQYSAPAFAADGMTVLFVGWGERLLAETDSDGNAVGTYSDTVASVYSAVANTAGSRRIVDGLKFPDGVYTDRWSDMFDFYEYIPEEVSAE